jgi:hypothetical protein
MAANNVTHRTASGNDVTSRTASGNDITKRVASFAIGNDFTATARASTSSHGHWIRAHTTRLRYSLTSYPPIPVALFIAFQVSF